MTPLRAARDAVLPLSLLVGAAVLLARLGVAALAALPPIDWDAAAGAIVLTIVWAFLFGRACERR